MRIIVGCDVNHPAEARIEGSHQNNDNVMNYNIHEALRFVFNESPLDPKITRKVGETHKGDTILRPPHTVRSAVAEVV